MINFFLDSFQDQMKRELSYREEMVQQLQIVRGEHSTSSNSLTLKHQLDQSWSQTYLVLSRV